jgi:hypothetical protein
MAGPIFKVWLAKGRDAFYRLSPEEREELFKKGQEALKSAGGERVISCDSTWCSENWNGFGVEKFPDLESVQKYTNLLMELDWFGYLDANTYLGTEVPEE